MGQTERTLRSNLRQTGQERAAPTFIRLMEGEDDADGATIHEKVYQRIRKLILSGSLASGARLAPSRSLARLLGISRNSVMTALDRLIADGLLESRQGSGVYVAYAGARAPSVTARPDPNCELPLTFQLGAPPTDLFPSGVWHRLQSRRWRHISPALLRDDDAAGWRGLREAIAAHVAMARGLECSAEQIVVTSCTAAAVDLAVRALGLAGHEIWMENPCYLHAAQAFQNSGVHLVPVTTDSAGLDPAAGRALSPNARAAYVTPACQFPLSVTMSVARRRALTNWVRENKAWLLEDDFDWNTSPMPPKPIAAQLPDRTIYFHTFNHILFSTLRIAFIVAPPQLVDRFIAIQSSLHGGPHIPNQMVMADFINSGHLDEHLKLLRESYAERRKALLDSIRSELSDFLFPLPTDAGTHIICQTRRLSAQEISAIAERQGIFVSTMARFELIAVDNSRVLLGYAGFPTPAIKDAACRLRMALTAGR